MQADTNVPGILNKPAPPLGVRRWIGADDEPLTTYELSDMPGSYKLLFCFQAACPGCHVSGFPTLRSLVNAFRGNNFISFAAIQTAFENFEENTWDAMLQARQRYALAIPFGHDDGTANDNELASGSVLMHRYGNGGTPWFILISPEGRVIYNDFYLDADQIIDILRRAQSPI
jgi:hypothetical protein